MNGGIWLANSEAPSERLAVIRTNGRTRTTSRLPTRLVVETRMSWRVALDSVGGREPVALAGGGEPLAESADRAAQGDLDAFRQGREIRLAVERSINGAAHESRAAKSGQDRAGEPLDGDATAIDDAGAAID